MINPDAILNPVTRRILAAVAMKITCLAVLLNILALHSAHADMTLSPLRQVIDQANPVALFSVSNPSDRMLEGRVSWADLTATETGYAPAPIALRPKLSAAPYLVISPAQFTLEPGGHVDISVRLADGAAIPKGERRSHLMIETAAARSRIRKASDSGLQVDIGLAMSAPVILRGAGGKAKASIGDTKLVRDEEGLLSLETSIIPRGDHSSYGRIEVYFEPNQSNAGEQLLGLRDNVAGFLDADRRKVETPLGFVSLDAGELTVRYQGAAEYEGRVFDERSFEIAPPE